MWWTSCIGSIIGGIFVSMSNIFIFEPYRQYIKLKCEIKENIMFYRRYLTDLVKYTYSDCENEAEKKKRKELIEKHNNASEKLRYLSSKLEGFIADYPVISWNIPSKVVLKKVSQKLMNLSNSLLAYENEEGEELIKHRVYNEESILFIINSLKISNEEEIK